jgi:hypothetical protein
MGESETEGLANSLTDLFCCLGISGSAGIIFLNQVQGEKADTCSEAGLVVFHDEELDNGLANVCQVQDLRELDAEIEQVRFQFREAEMGEVANVQTTDLVFSFDRGAWDTSRGLSTVQNGQRFHGKGDLFISNLDAFADGRIGGSLRSRRGRDHGGRMVFWI